MQLDLFGKNKIIIDKLEKKEILLQFLEKQWIEIQNGIEYGYVQINKSDFDDENIINTVKCFYNSSQYLWKINYLININFEKNIEIYSFLNCNINYEKNLKEDINIYLKSTKDTAYIKQSLLSELKSINEQNFNAPLFISNKNNKLENLGILSNKNWNLFENKIDVNAYNFFEAVHPAYAYQIIAIYKFLVNNKIPINYFIDIGSGPGTALQMLLEVIESYSKVDTIEPSPTAFLYLKEKFKDNLFVNPVQKGFFEFEPENSLNLAISVGASHHFNTYFLFQHANKILEEGGYLIISDEFISPFKTKHQRYENIINHHLGYIIDLLKLAPQIKNLPISCSDEEIELVRLAHHLFPKIKIEVLSGHLELSCIMCKDLLVKMTNLIQNNFDISNSFLAYYRLMFLELQALVAGLDYEVECKTYVENLINMALENNFTLIKHERIYATSKGNKFNSGTHLVCFKKN